MENRRIRIDVVDLEPHQVRDFFERRGRDIDPASPITSVLYQDKNPGLAQERDLHERTRIGALLPLQGSEHVLDVGCGIGRWAKHLGSRVAGGLGLDVSSTLVEFARSQEFETPWKFERMSADRISREHLASLGFDRPFDLVIVSGLCIYLNDEMVDRMLAGIAEVTRAGSVVYVREPIAKTERLTLKNYWSDELNDTYNAIYRTRACFDARFREIFGRSLRVLHEGPMYEDDGLNNRRETFQYFWILERGAP